MDAEWKKVNTAILKIFSSTVFFPVLMRPNILKCVSDVSINPIISELIFLSINFDHDNYLVWIWYTHIKIERQRVGIQWKWYEQGKWFSGIQAHEYSFGLVHCSHRLWGLMIDIKWHMKMYKDTPVSNTILQNMVWNNTCNLSYPCVILQPFAAGLIWYPVNKP